MNRNRILLVMCIISFTLFGYVSKISQFEQTSDYENQMTLSKRAVGYMEAGEAQAQLGEYEEAIYFWLKGIEFFKKASDWWWVGQSYCEIAAVQEGLGKYQEAIDSWVKSIEFFTKISDWIGVGFAYDGIAEAQAQLGKYDEAIDFWIKTVELRGFLGDDGRIFLIPGMVSRICYFGEKNIREEDEEQAEKLAEGLAKIWSEIEKDKEWANLIKQEMEDFETRLSKEDEEAFQKFKMLFVEVRPQ